MECPTLEDIPCAYDMYVCSAFFLHVASCRYQLRLTGLLCHLRPLCLFGFQSRLSVHWCQWDVNISYYCCIVSVSLFMFVSICFLCLGAPVLGVRMLTSVIPSYYIDPFIIIQGLPCLHYSFYFKGWYDFLWVLLPTLCHFYFHETSFSILLHTVCVFSPEVSLIQTAYLRVLVFVFKSSQSPTSFDQNI